MLHIALVLAAALVLLGAFAVAVVMWERRDAKAEEQARQEARDAEAGLSQSRPL